MNTLRYIATKLIPAVIAMAVAMAALASCAGDNVHQPEPVVVPEPERYEGVLTSDIPIVPTFIPIPNDDYAIVTWQNESRSMVSIELGSFFVHINEVNMSIDIGTMVIEGITCTIQADGTYLLSQPAFECMAGPYFTTGRLTGTLSAGKLDFEILYRPGSMPFEVYSHFISN